VRHFDRRTTLGRITLVALNDIEVSGHFFPASAVCFLPILLTHQPGKELVITPEPIYAKSDRAQRSIPAETPNLHIAHMENFFDCMRSRQPPNLNADFGYRAMVAIGLGVEAYRESRQLCFDPISERVVKSSPKREAYEGTGKNVDETKPS